MAERCPICGEEIVLGECQSCGFEAPDLSEIAAPYDLDPSNDHFGEADSLEGMFPADMTDIGDGSLESGPEFEIPSIALPNLQSLNSLGLTSVKAKPAPRIVVVRSNPLPGANPLPLQNTQNAPKAQPKRQKQSLPPVQTFQSTSNAQTAQAVQTAQTLQNQQNASAAAPFVPYVQQASLSVRIVKGTVNFVIAHWWKFLIMAAAPSAGLLFMGYYIFQFRTDRHTADLLKAIMFGVLTGVMLVNRWDPFGLDVILRELLDIIFGDRRRRRRGYY